MNCPRCTREPIRNHGNLECLVHGEFYARIEAWERVAIGDVQPGRVRLRQPVMPISPAWTIHERELWRMAEAGEPVALPDDCRPFTEAEDARLCILRQSGWTWNAIAKDIGRDKATVWHRWQRLEGKE